jgi:hypothetical protein
MKKFEKGKIKKKKENNNVQYRSWNNGLNVNISFVLFYLI